MDVDKSWIPKCIEFLKKIEQNNYSWIIREDAKNDKSCRLDAAALFCKLARIFDNHHQFNKKKMADAVLRFKDGNNYYKDAPKKNDYYIAETRQAMSGLVNIGYTPDKINLDRDYKDAENLYFMRQPKQWDDPWNNGAQLSHYLFFCYKNGETERIDAILKKIEKYQHPDGWYNKKPNNTVRTNGIMKVFTGLDAMNYDYKKIEPMVKTIVDSIIKWSPDKGGCNLYDYVYVLAKAVSINYRVEESKEKLIKVYNKILTYQQPDGGFSYSPKQSRTDMYGKKIPNGKGIGDVHGTTLHCMSLWIIDKACNLNLNLNTVVS